jgi:transposase-like protein
VVNTLGMKTFNGSFRRRRAPRTSPARRAQLLAEFDRSGLSPADFARRHGLHCTTFYGWQRRREQSPAGPGFVEVRLPESAAPVELVIELGAGARLRLSAATQIPLAAQLIGSLNPPRPC